MMFTLCYFTWVGVHVQRTFWSMSKTQMADQNPDLSVNYFAKIDTALFQTYSISQFFTGAIGDAYDRRKVLAISLTIQAVLFFIMGSIGEAHQTDLQSQLYSFMTLFALVGIIQSVDFPCLVSTMGVWTQKSTRGFVTGVWATCANTGNILGF